MSAFPSSDRLFYNGEISSFPRLISILVFHLDFADIQVQLSSLSDILEQIKTTSSISSRSNVRDLVLVSLMLIGDFRMVERRRVEVIHLQRVLVVLIHSLHSMLNDKIILKCRKKVRFVH